MREINTIKRNMSKNNPLDKGKDDVMNNHLSRTLVSVIKLLL
jgi:hypothetical protein